MKTFTNNLLAVAALVVAAICFFPNTASAQVPAWQTALDDVEEALREDAATTEAILQTQLEEAERQLSRLHGRTRAEREERERLQGELAEVRQDLAELRQEYDERREEVDEGMLRLTDCLTQQQSRLDRILDDMDSLRAQVNDNTVGIRIEGGRNDDQDEDIASLRDRFHLGLGIGGFGSTSSDSAVIGQLVLDSTLGGAGRFRALGTFHAGLDGAGEYHLGGGASLGYRAGIIMPSVGFLIDSDKGSPDMIERYSLTTAAVVGVDARLGENSPFSIGAQVGYAYTDDDGEDASGAVGTVSFRFWPF